MRSFLLLLPFLFLPAVVSVADTIILKNGRRIVVGAVTEEEGKVTYEGESGPVTLPASIVERIEKGGAPARRPMAVGRSPADEALAREMAEQLQPPPGDAEEIIRAGAVDEGRLRSLTSLASRGGLERQSAVNALLTAAVFEARQQRLASASQWAEEALRLSARDSNALLVAAQIDIARQQYGEAVDHLLLAQSMSPGSPDVLTLLGHAYYYAEGPEKALRHWKQAYSIRPNQNLQEMIRRAERESEVEGGFAHAQSGQFVLNWEGSEVSDSLGREILGTLEQHYRKLESEMDFSPREPIAVIVYTAQQFQAVTHAPGWVGALNDGKIRVPVKGLSSVTGRLAQVLQHEMVHSFVHRQVQGRCPTWLNEGLAQVLSGDSLSQAGPALARLYAASRQVPLAQLEGSFMGFDSSMAAVAYGESHAAVEMIREQYGGFRLSQLLQSLADGQPMAQALERVLRVSYEELDAEVGEYLRRSYGP